jgi:MATE family multidrug resistance protein
VAADDAGPIASPFSWHMKRTLVLAWPLILSRVGVLMMTTLDVVVVGRAGAEQLAFYVLGYAIIDSLIAMTAGLQLGVSVLTARSVGAGQPHLGARIWRRGLVFALGIGALLALVTQAAPFLFGLTGHSPELAEGGGAVTAMLGLSLPFFGLFLVSTMFLEAQEKPFLGTIAVGLALIVNLGLSILLTFGAGPIPALGAWGCALATVITSILLGFGLSLYVRYGLPGRALFGLGVAPSGDQVPASEQVKLGLAAGASYGLEAAAFSAITLFAGLVGVLGLASMGVLFQLFALTFMISFGIAGATQVRVGNAWGRGSPPDMARAGLAGLALSLSISSTVCLLYLGFPAFFAGLMTSDEAVLAASLPVMIWMVLALVADGGQTVLNHACRGRGDTWVPTLLHLFSYWCVMVPLAYYLALTLGGGTAGLYQAILISSLVSVLSMGGRFSLLVARARVASPRKGT